MMARLGMDVDVVRRVGTQLNAQGDGIIALVGRVDAMVTRAASAWEGRRGQEFLHQWQTVHRPAVLAAAHATSGLGQSAVNNVEAQRTASALAGGAVLHGGFRSVMSELAQSEHQYASEVNDALHVAQGVLDQPLLAATLKPLGLFAVLGSNAALTGRYSNRYNSFARGVSRIVPSLGRDFFDYKQSLNGTFRVGGLADGLSRSKVLNHFNHVAGAIGVYNDAAPAFDANATVGQRISAVVKSTGDTLQSSDNPVAYLGGMALKSVNMSVEEASKADFSASGWSLVVNEMKRNPDVILESGADAFKEVFTKKIWEIM